MDPTGTFEAYINGQRQAVGGSVPAAPVSKSANVTIGAGGYYGLSSFFDGVIDDIRIYERALSEAEIHMLSIGF